MTMKLSSTKGREMSWKPIEVTGHLKPTTAPLGSLPETLRVHSAQGMGLTLRPCGHLSGGAAQFCCRLPSPWELLSYHHCGNRMDVGYILHQWHAEPSWAPLSCGLLDPSLPFQRRDPQFKTNNSARSSRKGFQTWGLHL